MVHKYRFYLLYVIYLSISSLFHHLMHKKISFLSIKKEPSENHINSSIYHMIHLVPSKYILDKFHFWQSLFILKSIYLLNFLPYFIPAQTRILI